jgi:quinol monooxygenase YgiN
MLIVYGGVQVDPARVSEVTDAARAFEARCRREDGCVQYVLGWRVDEPSRIQLLEAWETEDAWETHKQQPHVQEWSTFVADASAGPPAFSHHVVA